MFSSDLVDALVSRAGFRRFRRGLAVCYVEVRRDFVVGSSGSIAARASFRVVASPEGRFSVEGLHRV